MIVKLLVDPNPGHGLLARLVDLFPGATRSRPGHRRGAVGSCGTKRFRGGPAQCGSDRDGRAAYSATPGDLDVPDGQQNSIGVIWNSRLDDCRKHLAPTCHVHDAMVHVVDADVLDRLTGGQRTIPRRESRAAGGMMREAVRVREAGEIAALEEAGMAVTRPDLAPFAELIAARERMAEYGGWENTDTVLGLLEGAGSRRRPAPDRSGVAPRAGRRRLRRPRPAPPRRTPRSRR